MIPDTPAADAAPTRRSSRTAPTPVQASESADHTRAARRRAQQTSPHELDPTASATPAVSAVIPEPLRAGLRSRVRNMPMTDAEADALGGAGIPDERPVEAAPIAERTRRTARLAASAASVPSDVAPTQSSVSEFVPTDSSVSEPPASAEAPVTAPVTRPVSIQTADASSEPVITGVPTESADDNAARNADEFEAALLRLGSGPVGTIPSPEAAPSAENADSDAHTDAYADSAAHVAARGARRAGFLARRLATASFSFGVMGIVGLLAVGMTTPVEAVAAAGGGEGPTASIVALADADDETDLSDDIQAYVAPAGSSTVEVSREEGYAAVTMAQLAVESGIRDTAALYVNNASSAVQWPFPVGVPMSSGFGLRWGYLHAGIDLIPGGEGAPIRAIADGVVRISTEAGGSYGVHMIIDHIVNGELVSSHYAHMQRGSLAFQPGAAVKVGDVIGSVGNTGHSTGPHLHFEILLNGATATDPIPWMTAHNVAETVVTLPGAAATATE